MLPCSACDDRAAVRRVSHGGGDALPVCERQGCAARLCPTSAPSLQLLLVGPRRDKRQREDEEPPQPVRLEFESTLTGLPPDAKRLILSRVPLVDLLGSATLVNREAGALLDGLDWRAIYARSIVPFYGAREDLVLGSWRAQTEAYLTSCDLTVTDAEGNLERVLPFETARSFGAIQFRQPTDGRSLPASCLIHAPWRLPADWWEQGKPLRISVTLRKKHDPHTALDRADYVGPTLERSAGWRGSFLARAERYTGTGRRITWETSKKDHDTSFVADFSGQSGTYCTPFIVARARSFSVHTTVFSYLLDDVPKVRARLLLEPMNEASPLYQNSTPAVIESSTEARKAALICSYRVSAYRCVIHLPPAGTRPDPPEEWRRLSLDPQRSRIAEMPPLRRYGEEGDDAPARDAVCLSLTEHVWFRPVVQGEAYLVEVVTESVELAPDPRFARSRGTTRWRKAYQGRETGAFDLQLDHSSLGPAVFARFEGELTELLARFSSEPILPWRAPNPHPLAFRSVDVGAIVFRTSADALATLPCSYRWDAAVAVRGRSYNIASQLGQ